MKKILAFMLLLLTAVTASAQEEEFISNRPNPVLPGPGHLNLETMLHHIDLNMDISKLTLSELRVLRNAFAARQGYAFTSAELRSVFSGTTWYDSIMMNRWDLEEERGSAIPLKYTPKESAFIKRISAREAELQKQNFVVPAGQLVNTRNIINPYQLENIDPRLEQMLGRYGFAIVPEQKEQLFHIYERNDYQNFPSFVTTDLFLQAFHMYFDCMTREAEENTLLNAMVELSHQMYEEMNRVARTTQKKDIRRAANFNAAFFAIGYALLTDKPLPAIDTEWKTLAEQELDFAKQAGDHNSEFLDYTKHSFPYSLFRPRGHYTRSEKLKRYFRGMMWLQTAPYKLDIDFKLGAAALMASSIANNAKLVKTYKSVSDPITFLFGAPDNITILQLNEVMVGLGLTPETVIGNSRKTKQLHDAAVEMAKRQTRILPKDDEEYSYMVNLMPQRYMPDAEVLQEMVDHENNPAQRVCPKGLDVMAAIGIPAAERILLQELKEQQGWSGFTKALEQMEQRMKEIDWNETVATQWINSLKVLCDKNSKYPYFMQTPQWDKKNLNSALASWAELKHDAILYAKQPAGAECGGDGPPPPIVKGYVEPNVSYWQLALTLIDATEAVYTRYNLSTEKTHDISDRLREEAQFLLNISKKELQGKRLNDQEYLQIMVIGAEFENLTLDLLRQPDQEYLYGWESIEGADRSISVVADVITASYKNIPINQRSILYEAVGPACEIYVIVEIDGLLYLTRGAVFSYREFQRALSEPRWTDEEWQEQLKQQPRTGEPDWMQEITVPLESTPAANETFFYSSGC